jgi:hypothetical protein
MKTQYMVHCYGYGSIQGKRFGPMTKKKIESHLKKRGFEKVRCGLQYVWFRMTRDGRRQEAHVNRLCKVTSLK